MIALEMDIKITAQDFWRTADQYTRQKMLEKIGFSQSFSRDSWSKLKYQIKINLDKHLESDN